MNKLHRSFSTDLSSLEDFTNDLRKELSYNDKIRLLCFVFGSGLMIFSTKNIFARVILKFMSKGSYKKKYSFYAKFFYSMPQEEFDKYYEGFLTHIVSGKDTSSDLSVGGYNQDELDMIYVTGSFS